MQNVSLGLWPGYFQLLREKQAQTNSSDRAPTLLSRIVPAPLLTPILTGWLPWMSHMPFSQVWSTPSFFSPPSGSLCQHCEFSQHFEPITPHPHVCSVHDRLAPSPPDCSTRAGPATFCPQLPLQRPLPFLSRLFLTHLVNGEVSWDSVLCSVPSPGQLKASNATFLPPVCSNPIDLQLSPAISTRVLHSPLK